jgi:hypothetical protein
MIYELRVYQPVPGQMPELLARFRDKLLPIRERHGIRPIPSSGNRRHRWQLEDVFLAHENL